MNSRTKDIICFRSYLPDALRLRFEDKLSIRIIARRLGLSHSTIHTLFQRFIASGIAWPLPDSISFAQLDAILYANRKNESTRPEINEEKWRKDRRASYSREFKVSLVKQTLRPSAVVARIAREGLDINDNLLGAGKSVTGTAGRVASRADREKSMISLPSGTRIWLVAGVTDMRKSFNGLSELVQHILEENPFSGHLFIFRGRKGDTVKM